MRQDERFTITEISGDGQPNEPRQTKEAFSAHCGAIVRDMIPISIHQWNKPKNEDPQVSYVEDRQKDDLWTALKENFTLPAGGSGETSYRAINQASCSEEDGRSIQEVEE